MGTLTFVKIVIGIIGDNGVGEMFRQSFVKILILA